uniref:Uncharacterized protein n=1 Tax=Siphoviridae sp. ctXZx16 TaxID=2826371 RepID=A0A8S5MLV3_9CAUD|nr:MAG TPA: hypothetical protein [Siphoviridae sp. ctXZx16]
METLKFSCVEDFCEYIVDTIHDIAKEDPLNDVTVIAKYDEMREIFAELIRYGYECMSIDTFHPVDFDGYNGEYVLMIYDNELWLSLARNKEGIYYDNCGASKVFILDNCSSKVIQTVDTDDAYEVNIEEEDDDACCGCCDCCEAHNQAAEILKDEDGNICGFAITKHTDNGHSSYSYYNSNGLDVEDLIEKLRFDF